ncbi:rRNA-processing protein UTP23 [Spathaspora sp. JA1]|nr:rRNA-processing protein UTP23 [Spathaspora sp. JA1]
MRQKRAKSYKKQMTVYHHTFKFRSPYQVLLDNELVLNVSQSSYNVMNGLTKTIQGEIKPMITQCCVQALYDSKDQKAIDLAKTFERRRCNHREPIDPADCIESVVDINGVNKHRYVVACQNLSLRKKLRKIPGVPMIFMNRSVMVMEPLSDVSAKYSKEFEDKKLTAGLNALESAKRKNVDEEPGSEEPPKKKKKGPKEPNPLSIKKKKTTKTEQSSTEEPKKKPNRRRKHKSSTEANPDTEEAKEPTTKTEESSGSS